MKEMLGDCKIHYENGEYIIYFKNEDDFKEADKKLIEYVLNFLSGIQ
ncbi:MAG: hypothetical protein ACPLZF_04925 [Nitrososphaeria archaeon]